MFVNTDRCLIEVTVKSRLSEYSVSGELVSAIKKLETVDGIEQIDVEVKEYKIII